MHLGRFVFIFTGLIVPIFTLITHHFYILFYLFLLHFFLFSLRRVLNPLVLLAFSFVKCVDHR